TPPTANAPLTFTDNAAPAASNVSYTVIALTLTTFQGLPGQPNAGPNTGEKPQASNTVAVVTPAVPPPRWALRPDYQPSIPPSSKVLLFIHGMDSRAEEAEDITKALFMTLPSMPVTPPPPVLPPITANRSTV